MAAGKPTQTLAFDVYGTLLDTGSISVTLTDHLKVPGEKASEIATRWRMYQLEYTWRMNSMGIYEPFDVVTRKSLLNAALDFGFDLSTTTAEAIYESYCTLSPYPDAVDALKALGQHSDVEVVVFSNGSANMISSAMDASSLAALVKKQYLADSVRKYKPCPDIYRGLVEFVGRSSDPGKVWLVSGNPFDVTGARESGMNAIWVDRAGNGWHDRLVDAQPTTTVSSLTEVASYILNL
ncbi:haloacid dehalogenase [Amylostereum chailletii]|nr:haloacid dehalogenase [Amylostereum chailletii]